MIIFSRTEEDHIEHVDHVLKALYDAGMRVSLKKSKFFKEHVEYLGFTVVNGGITTSSDNVKAILEYQIPMTLFVLRSFLGLASFYRCFVKGFASIAKPLTELLKGDNGKIGTNHSKKIAIELNTEKLKAFDKLKQILSSEDVLLTYPDFSKPFDLRTDASSSGLGAVLSQAGRPITMISRTLRDREKNFATNKRELLPIVWALRTLETISTGCEILTFIPITNP